MSLQRVMVPANVGLSSDPPAVTQPDRQYVELPASARLPECDCDVLVGGQDPDPQYG